MIENIVAGLIVTILGAVIIYAFKIRQLYLVIPRLFSSSLLSDTGKLVELRIFNKGSNSESNIQIFLDPIISYEIVASTDHTSKIDNSIILIPRIAPRDDYSVLLLVEGGDFTKDRVSSISSSSTKGKLIKEIGDVPPNTGKAILLIFAFIVLILTPIVGLESYSSWKESQNKEAFKKHLTEVTKSLDQKWDSLDSYLNSDFEKNYKLGEFPIYLTGLHRNGNRVILNFKLINKSAARLDVNLTIQPPFLDKDPEPWKSSIYEHKTVSPASTDEIQATVFVPKGQSLDLQIPFQLAVGAEKYISAKTYVKIDI